jgi:hypothetical protein
MHNLIHGKLKRFTIWNILDKKRGLWSGLWMLSATFNYISAISWRPMLLVGVTGHTPGKRKTCHNSLRYRVT